MKARLRFAAIGVMAALAGSINLAPGFARPAQSPAKARISVVGIDRAGASVRVTAFAFTGQNPPVQLSTKARSLAAGQYWIGAAVTTPGTGGAAASETLVVRHVRISRSERLVFDARPGKPVRISLGIRGATDSGDQVQACMTGGQGGFWSETGMPGSLFVVLIRSKVLAFGYGSTWLGGTATYELAKQARGGIPARPVYRVTMADLAAEHVVLRGGTTPGAYQGLQPERIFGAAGCTLYPPELPMTAAPSAARIYLTAGSWQLQMVGYRGFWQDTKAVAAGRRYTDVFGAAVWGPGDDYPTLDFGQLDYYPQAPFSDPLQPVGTECCDKSSITLFSHGRLIKHQTMSEFGANRSFSLRLHSAGWYTMRVKAWRWAPGVPIPSSLLSSGETVAWKFYVGSHYSSVDSVVMPVTATRYVPEGLNIDNEAQPGASTKIEVHVERAAEAGWTALRYRLRAIRFQVSFNGGGTWRSVRLVRHGRYWLAAVTAASAGYVALRSTVTDVRGDSTVQTIYRAYRVS